MSYRFRIIVSSGLIFVLRTFLRSIVGEDLFLWRAQYYSMQFFISKLVGFNLETKPTAQNS